MSNISTNQAPCMWMRGGTSKGGYFLAEDLPTDKHLRDKFLLEIMGSPIVAKSMAWVVLTH